MSTLYAIIGLVLALGVAGYWLYRRGRSARAGDDAIASNKVKDEQLEAANRRHDPAAVVDRLRKNDF